jgi:Protein of unknown function (DUF3307)
MLKLTAADWMLLCLAYLAIKHAIADFFLQTKYQWENKGRYGHPGGLLHAAIHTVFSLPIFWMVQPESAQWAALVLAAEFVVHYHCDWIKEQILKQYALTYQDDGFWRALGIDQLVHGLTYVAMVRALV